MNKDGHSTMDMLTIKVHVHALISNYNLGQAYLPSTWVIQKAVNSGNKFFQPNIKHIKHKTRVTIIGYCNKVSMNNCFGWALAMSYLVLNYSSIQTKQLLAKDCGHFVNKYIKQTMLNWLWLFMPKGFLAYLAWSMHISIKANQN